MTKEQLKEIIEMYKEDALDAMKKDKSGRDTQHAVELCTFKRILWLFEDEDFAGKMYEILLERRRIEKELEELKIR